jgi:Protein of unknown function (DUF4031)
MIFVDKIQTYPASMCRGLPGRQWCHLISDTSVDELHAFATSIGLRRGWAQLPPKASTPHYDLTPSRRAQAVAAGAREVERNEFVAAVRRLRGRGVELPAGRA